MPLAGTDTSDLRASFRGALSFSIPPLTLYRDCRAGAYSDLIFGVPLVDLEIKVPKVMRICVEEVEKRPEYSEYIFGELIELDGGSVYDGAEVLELRRWFESDKTFSFSSTDNICSVAMLLGFSYYESLKFISDLSSSSTSGIFQRCFLSKIIETTGRIEIYCKRFFAIAIEDPSRHWLWRISFKNAYTLFDEHPSPSQASTFTYGPLFLSPGSPQAEVPAMGSATQHRPEFLGGIPTSAQAQPSPTLFLLITDALVNPPTGTSVISADQ
ncbi:hypothetical protein EDB85DRAFT_2299641 [Lactarius pseudohatsudake]|nr:hypothetical protein EDB85DRAFT_2299641 [Lactarius pseudohatsudake]